MDSLPTTDMGRRALTYSLEGLMPREEILFKSLVRLLDHLTVQKWVYRPASMQYRVDLLVVAERYSPTLYQGLHPVAQPVLSICKGFESEMCLSWPVQPQRLQAVLNRIGNTAMQVPMGDVQHSAEPLQTTVAGDGTDFYRLKQWPPSRYLAGVGRMRLATLLTGKAMSLNELQQRSALSLSVCTAFVSDLQKGQLLDVTVFKAPPPPPEPHQLLNLQSSAAAFAKPGLLARIRAGLGIRTSHNA